MIIINCYNISIDKKERAKKMKSLNEFKTIEDIFTFNDKNELEHKKEFYNISKLLLNNKEIFEFIEYNDHFYDISKMTLKNVEKFNKLVNDIYNIHFNSLQESINVIDNMRDIVEEIVETEAMQKRLKNIR